MFMSKSGNELSISVYMKRESVDEEGAIPAGLAGISSGESPSFRAAC
jgi:hypothetical protein